MKELGLTIPKTSSLFINYGLSQPTRYGGHFSMGVLINGMNKNGKSIAVKRAGLYTCREDVCDYDVRDRLRKLHNVDERINKWFPKTRVISLLQDNRPEDMLIAAECGIKNINIVEKSTGWPLSKIYLLKNEYIHPTSSLFYLEGNRRWIKSPHMLSLYLLLFRAGKNIKTSEDHKVLMSKKTLPALYKFWEKRLGTDRNYMVAILPKIKKVFKNYYKLFGTRTMRELYLPAKTGPPWILVNEGIQKLIEGHSTDLELNAKWARL